MFDGKPEWILKMFDGKPFYDPCPLNPQGLRDQDGLGDVPDGFEKVYCHPDYAKSEEWVDWSIRQAERGKQVHLLLKHDHTTKWYQKLYSYGAHPLMIGRREKFNGSSSGAPFISTLFILEAKTSKSELTVLADQKAA